MKYAFFSGCKIPYYSPQYGASVQSLLQALNVNLVELNFNCCGYPQRNFDRKAFLLLAARNIAIAEESRLDILTPCKCCFGNLKQAQHILAQDSTLKAEINRLLEVEDGRHYHGKLKIKHVLTVLAEDVGLPAIRARVQHPLTRLKIAVHYGCHALRPSHVTCFDNPAAPTIFENLVHLTGAQCVNWTKRLECCGHPVWDINQPLSLALLTKKLESAVTAGADYVCTACTYCQLQFDLIQSTTGQQSPARDHFLPAILFSQLLGLSFGLPECDLGIQQNYTQPRLIT